MRAFCRTNSSSVFSLIWNINEVSGRHQAGRTLPNRSRASFAKVRLLRPHDSAWKIIMRWDVLPLIMNDYSPKWSWYLFTRTSRLKMNCKGYSEVWGPIKVHFQHYLLIISWYFLIDRPVLPVRLWNGLHGKLILCKKRNYDWLIPRSKAFFWRDLFELRS